MPAPAAQRKPGPLKTGKQMSKSPVNPPRDSHGKAPQKRGAKPLARAGAAPAAASEGAVKSGDRIAKVLARVGVSSRRGAEAMIEEGRVSVNGVVIDSPALNVTARDKIAVDGAPIGKPEPVRVWLYNKPLGLVTSERDEKGRTTVFETLPEDLPRVMSVGRLDLNSEGLLLLTNDGDLKRRLELPSTGWLRKYRARVNGTPTEAMLEPLRRGINIDGEQFQPMMVTIDKQQGANAWLSVGIREGRNREVRRAMDHVGLAVNRLIRVAYGPFQLGNLRAGEVEELRPRSLRDQLGLAADEVAEGRAGPAVQSRLPETRGKTDARGKPDARGKTGPKAAGQPARKPMGKPMGKRAGGPMDDSDPAAGRKSWGSKSHGGATGGKPASRGKAGGAPAGKAAAPKSWGTKSARSTQTTPRKPPTGR